MRKNPNVNFEDSPASARGPTKQSSSADSKGFSSPDETSSLLMTIDDVAILLRLSTRQIFRMKAAGHLPKEIRIGSSIRWRRKEIEAWILGYPQEGDKS
ncbi:helix-turn-helix transcriptional regulator [Lacipirellula sp.]|uniref:helix-turn-helix transcriptional regulator n=1 Tax=Lacipirellula sp. TaxID=2691419 RepID=UPI003D132D82